MLVQFGNNWIQKIPLTAKLDSACGLVQFWLSSEFFSSNYFQIGQHVVLLHILIEIIKRLCYVNLVHLLVCVVYLSAHLVHRLAHRCHVVLLLQQQLQQWFITSYLTYHLTSFGLFCFTCMVLVLVHVIQLLVPLVFLVVCLLHLPAWFTWLICCFTCSTK